MEKRKLTKEDLDKVRDIEGFPIGTDEDIIALSDAPYYTACPNPFIKEFIAENGTPYDEETDDYHCEPFAADVSEGKNDPIYMAHTYHTKVPYKAIMRYILHYTKPGDIVFDGFCGTGMTGFAAQMCERPDAKTKYKIEAELGKDNVKWGIRKAIINDLSPAASFISYNYNTRIDPAEFSRQIESVLRVCEEKCAWMYKTEHVDGKGKPVTDVLGNKVLGDISYTVWSDVLVCPHCSHEMVYWDVAVDQVADKVLKTFKCPHCGQSLQKKDCDYAQESFFDTLLNQPVTMKKQAPVKICYFVHGKRAEKRPQESDFELLKKINELPIEEWVPAERMPKGGESRRNDKYGITHIHQFMTKRNLITYAVAVEEAKNSRAMFALTAITKILTKMYRWAPHGKCTAGMPGTLYMPSVTHEYAIFDVLRRRVNKFSEWLSTASTFNNDVLISCGDLAHLPIAPNSVDYIFTDPPFGANLSYSELSFLWEAWLKVKTNNSEEAIINDSQGKSLVEYQQLMTNCFKAYYDALKPNHWMTVEFHNSQNSVWNAIQESLLRAGFVVADIRTLNKKQGTFQQTTAQGTVKQDLVISAYKPKEKFRKEFEDNAGSEETVWAFVRQHLANLPVVVDADHDGKIDIISDRQAYLLFDRMVAYHIMNGIPVPIDASDFYKGLDEKFLKRDGMYFLPDQVNEYDTARIKMDVEPIQFELFVTNEKSAIAWLYQQLDTPQTYAELQPKFMQEVKSVDRHEDMPELSVMLEENFIQDDKGRWYIPDRTKEGDVAKLREKNLWKEFESYMNSKGKLKLFRSEAIRVGFSRLWKDKNYQAIVDMAERLPEQTIQEDDKLLMYYDISLSRVQ